MRLLFPQALLLLVPALLLLWRAGRIPGPPGWLRLALAGMLVLALAQPEARLRAAGSDVVVVVDRSRSMPPGSEAKAEELIRLLEKQRRKGDRLGVVDFGREPHVELAPTELGTFGGFSRPVDAEASDLSAALDAAGELIGGERTGRVLVVSDGRATGVDPRGAARRLAARGIAVDYRWVGREDSALDVAVLSLDVPPQVAAKEPFQLTAAVYASHPAKAAVTLKRGGRPLVKGAYELREGENLLVFRDLVETPGLTAYELSVEAPGDGLPENNVGRAVLRVEGPPRVLLLSQAGEKSTLYRTLVDAGLQVSRGEPQALSMEALDGVGAVVVENEDAGTLGEKGLRVLAQYVTEAGGGLVMTGGRKAFGQGGYRKSVLEPVLPVSLEIRQEQRKAALAMSLLMDCSCSMGVRIADGRTKMELAAEGAVSALQLLNDNDEASVHMVDTAPHEIVPMTPVREGLPLDRVASGFSGGGGIYIDEALEEGRKQILQSNKATRHVVLFADAADSEQPGNYKDILEDLEKHHVTVSVIGMGSRKDSDAALLEEIATLGKGRIYFAEDVTSLPRIFSQETILVARASFVDGEVELEAGPDLALLGRPVGAGLPSVGGYNLTYLRPLAGVALRTTDENHAPLLAFWPHGTGRAAVYTGEVDGEYTGGIRNWPGYRAVLEQTVRWAMGGEGAREADAVARVARSGSDLHVTVDFDPKQPAPGVPPTLMLLSDDGEQVPLEVPLRWEDADRMGAHVALARGGTFHPVVKLAGRALRLPPATLPYPPEFQPGSAKEGQAVLAGIAAVSGGAERLSMAGLFAQTQESLTGVPLAPYLVAISVLALLAEVGTRRFLSGRRRTPRKAAVVESGVPAVTEPAKPAQARGAKAKPAEKAPAGEVAPLEKPAPPPEPKKPDLGDALAKARERAKGRLDR